MIYVFLANGFEEVEALAPVDVLRRAGVETVLVGVDGDVVSSTHGIKVSADINIEEMVLDDKLQGIILPGGMPGADNLNNSADVHKAIDYCVENGKIVSAICAAPYVLGEKGILRCKAATCYPGYEKCLVGADVKDEGVVTDGNIITARGAGIAWEFGAEIAAQLVGKEKSYSILKAIQWKK